MSAQEYYQSFQKQQRPNPAPFQNSPPSQPQSYGPGPRTSSGSLNATSQQAYPNPPYPITPGAIPQQTSPIPPYPVSDIPPTQYLAPPQPIGPGQSYFLPQTQLSSSYGPRPSDPYAYPPAAPLTLQRSTSEPPETRRTSLAPPPHRHAHHRRDSYSSEEDASDTRELERSGSGSRSRSRARSHHSRGSSDRSRSDRNTFLGAGGGAIVGDAIFPGLGTIGGLLLGGLGGHEYSRRRSRSEMAEGRKEGAYHHHHHKHDGSGKKENYGDGVTVVSEWGLIQR